MAAAAAGSGRATAAAPPEEVTQREIASRLLVSDRQVRNWKRDRGLPVRRRPTSGGGEEEYHLWADVLEWYVAERLRQAGQRGGRAIAGADAAAAAEDDKVTAADASKREAIARASKMETDAESARLSLDERRRSLVSIDFMAAQLEAVLQALRSGLQNFSGRWAPVLLGLESLPLMRTQLDAAVDELMAALAVEAADAEADGDWGEAEEPDDDGAGALG